jgi:hypothetical protein
LQSDDAVKNSNRKPSTRRAFVIHSLFGWIRIPSFHFTNAAECGRIELRKRQKQRRMASRAGKEGKWKRKCVSSMTKWNKSCVQEKFLAILNEY